MLKKTSPQHEFNNVATKAPLHGINWRNHSGVTVPSNYKLVHFDEDDAALLRDVYQIMYPESEIEMGSLGESIRKFGLLNICSTTSGSKMQPRGIRSGKILASGQQTMAKMSFKKHSVCPQAL